MRFNRDKMRRHVARSTPDRISQRFRWDVEDKEVLGWQQRWFDRMKIKHGDRAIERVDAVQSRPFDAPDSVDVELNIVLRDKR